MPGLALLRRASRRESPQPLMRCLLAADQDQARSGDRWNLLRLRMVKILLGSTVDFRSM